MGSQCSGMEFSITLKRQAHFYAIVLIFPTALLNVLSLAIFTLPVDNTERENFSLTLMLTYFVLIMIIVDTIPPTGHQVPLFGLYVILCTVVVVLTFGMSMLLIKMYEHKRSKKRKMPKALYQCLKACCGVEKAYTHYSTKMVKNRLKVEDPKTVSIDGNENAACEPVMGYETREDFKWKYLTVILNRIFFAVTLIAHILLLCIFFVP